MPVQNWLIGWRYRTPITLSVNESISDYSLRLNLTLPKAYGFDIRITDSDGLSILPHWIQEKNDINYILWTRVQNITDGKKIYVYYGNINAVDTQQPEQTFLFFDDFPGGIVDPGRWNVIYPSTWGSGYTAPYDDTTAELYNLFMAPLINTWLPLPLEVRVRWRPKTPYLYLRETQLKLTSRRSYVYDGRVDEASIYWYHGYVNRAQSVYYLSSFPYYGVYYTYAPIQTDGQFHEFFIQQRESPTWLTVWGIDNTSAGQSISFVSGMEWQLRIWCPNTKHTIPFLIDWAIVRRWHYPEPTYSVGVEEDFQIIAQREFTKETIPKPPVIQPLLDIK